MHYVMLCPAQGSLDLLEFVNWSTRAIQFPGNFNDHKRGNSVPIQKHEESI